MTLTDLSKAVGVTLANLSILKNDRAKAIRFSTLAAICEVLQCEIGELLVIDSGGGAAGTAASRNDGALPKTFLKASDQE